MIRLIAIVCLVATAQAWEVCLGWIQPETGQHVWAGGDCGRAAGWRIYAQEPTGPRLIRDVPNWFEQPAGVWLDLPDGPQTLSVVAYDDHGQESRGPAYTIIPAKVEASRDLKTWKVIAYRDQRDMDFVRIIGASLENGGGADPAAP